MAVITTMIEKTPTRTPSSVRAERSLWAASAPMAIREALAQLRPEQDCACGLAVMIQLRGHFIRCKASTGFMRAARQAGRKPESHPRDQRDQDGDADNQQGHRGGKKPADEERQRPGDGQRN